MNQIPEQLNQKILNEIKTRLNPDLKILFLKLFFIHVSTAVVTLSICPQFGFALFRTNINLMDVFMKISPQFCDFACGAFFTAASIFSALVILSRDELRVLRSKQIYSTLMLALSSVGFLIMLNPQLFVQFTFLWLIGCIGGSWLSLDIGTRVLKFS
ncbi:MAG: hypothetical protein WC635_12870 [Bacteriovorax sp.]|jgi:hypothetical protein